MQGLISKIQETNTHSVAIILFLRQSTRELFVSSNVKFVVCKGYSVDVAPVLRVDETTRNEGERFEVERMLEEDCCNETTQCRARSRHKRDT